MKRNERNRTSKSPKSGSRTKRRAGRPARPPTSAPPTEKPAPSTDEGVDLIGGFIADKRIADAETVAFILATATATDSLRDLVAGRWVSLAAVRVEDAADLPGYRTGRIFQLLERFAGWLHERGWIDAWSRDHLRHEIDEARYCHGLRPQLPTAQGLERVSDVRDLRDLARRFAESREHPVERQLGESAVVVLAREIDIQLGLGHSLPFGAVDVSRLVSETLDSSRPEDLEANASLFGLLAGFYRWLGDTDRLDAERAASQAAILAAAALGLSPAPSAGI